MTIRGLEGLPLFESAEAERRRDRGMRSVDGHAREVDPEWRAAFVAEAVRRARNLTVFTVEDVVAVVGKPAGVSLSACGPLMKVLRKMGLIEWTGEWKMADSVSRHRSPVRLWRGKRAA